MTGLQFYSHLCSFFFFKPPSPLPPHPPLARPSLHLVLVAGRSPNLPLLMICSSLPRKYFIIHTQVISEVVQHLLGLLDQIILQGSNTSLSTRRHDSVSRPSILRTRPSLTLAKRKKRESTGD